MGLFVSWPLRRPGRGQVWDSGLAFAAAAVASEYVALAYVAAVAAG